MRPEAAAAGRAGEEVVAMLGNFDFRLAIFDF
jgi:hypothetical protein